MKTIILFLCLLFSTTFSFSQNGGQHNENSVVRIDYLGQTSTGYLFRITNKQNCEVQIEYTHNNIINPINISGRGMFEFIVPNNSRNVKARTKSFCPNVAPDRGWVESEVLFTVPIKFKTFKGRKLDNNTLELDFEVEEDSDLDYYIIKVSYDGKSYKNVMLVFPENIQSNKRYIVKVKI